MQQMDNLPEGVWYRMVVLYVAPEVWQLDRGRERRSALYGHRQRDFRSCCGCVCGQGTADSEKVLSRLTISKDAGHGGGFWKGKGKGNNKQVRLDETTN